MDYVFRWLSLEIENVYIILPFHFLTLLTNSIEIKKYFKFTRISSSSTRSQHPFQRFETSSSKLVISRNKKLNLSFRETLFRDAGDDVRKLSRSFPRRMSHKLTLVRIFWLAMLHNITGSMLYSFKWWNTIRQTSTTNRPRIAWY